ncbi:hypothetical protein L9G74_21995, partial [Shewanella sp. C32]|nr:hypothetical protein [Shewanella electrica]
PLQVTSVQLPFGAFSYLLLLFASQLNCFALIHDLGCRSYLQWNLYCFDFSVFVVVLVMEGFYAS